ncbi:MAG: hypothetical protein N2422_08395 [Rhodobacteraceae bacterium]|nr:hypothetical protein [Paracoccaceae bacterium]
MQAVFHLGAHGTDDGRLVRCLLRSRGLLEAEGVAVPTPLRYRKLIRETLMRLRGGEPGEEDRAAILDAVLDGDLPARLVLSGDGFLGLAARALDGGRIYPAARRRAAGLANLFPEDACEFHIAIVHPAAFATALLARPDAAEVAAALAGADPLGLRWTPVIAALCDGVPDARIVVWCHEDAPLIWPEVLRTLIGRPAFGPLEGEEAFVQGLLSPEGQAELARRLAAAPPGDIGARRAAVADCLSLHPLPGALDLPCTVPGWTADTIARMTEIYEAELADVATLPGVEVIVP